MSDIELTLPDGSRVSGPVGLAAELLPAQLPPDAVALTLDGALVDLRVPIDRSGTIGFVLPGSKRAFAVRQNTAIHVLQLAVFRLYDQVEAVKGQRNDETFSADFDMPATISPDDFGRIEAEVGRIVAADMPLERVSLGADEAVAELRRQRSQFRAELVAGVATPVPFVRLGEVFEPACGATLPSTGSMGAFRIMSVAGAYFHDDETRPMLQRLWAAVFGDLGELDGFLTRREQAKERDHRKIGPRMKLFAMLPEAPSMPFWLPRGVSLLDTLGHYLRARYFAAGYEEIRTPQLLAEQQWRTSGHWEHYRSRMFVTGSETDRYAVRPMNCPGAILVYRMAERSYRELPLRLLEMGRVHRNEKSGTLHGLMRVREFTQDDAHIFCTEEGLEDEIHAIVTLVQQVYGDLGFDSYRVELSTRPVNAMGSDEAWARAEEALAAALSRAGIEAETDRGEGAFYGPKIDFHIADCLGREWQCGTIQVDFSNPVRFDLSYVSPEGRQRKPVLIHRAVLGSLERFCAVLLEHTGGELPLWLAPEQVRVLPVAEEKHGELCRQIVTQLRRRHVRAHADVRARTVGALVRQAEEELVPFVLVVGDEEIAADVVSVRQRGVGEVGRMTIDELLEAHRWYGPAVGEGDE